MKIIMLLIIGGAAGYYGAKFFLQNQMMNNVRAALQELLEEIDQLSESILSAGASTLEISQNLQAAGHGKASKILKDQTAELLESLILKEYEVDRSQGLLDSLDMASRNIFERNQRVNSLLTELKKE
jgi:hypothetical protein